MTRDEVRRWSGGRDVAELKRMRTVGDEVLAPIRERVNSIIAMGESDPGKAHMQDDALYAALMGGWLPREVLEEVRLLKRADFPRWYE